MLRRTAQAAAAVATVSQAQAAPADLPSPSAEKDAIWDMHCHMPAGTPEEATDVLLKYADRMGVGRLVVCMGRPFVQNPSPQEVRQQNDQVLRSIARSPKRVFGFVYLNPRHVEESLKELDRCVRDGPMVGVKLWVAIRCNDKRLDPIVERAAELKAIIFQHTWFKTNGNYPDETTPNDLAELAVRHPKASFIAGHTGGNWELGIRAIRAAGNISSGISGSDPLAGMVDMAVRELGAGRVMYGSDVTGRSYASQLAKVQGADIPQSAKRLILGGNIRRALQPILKSKAIKI